MGEGHPRYHSHRVHNTDNCVSLLRLAYEKGAKWRPLGFLLRLHFEQGPDVRLRQRPGGIYTT